LPFWLRRVDEHPSTINPKTSFGKELDRPRIDFVFLVENPGCEHLRRIVLKHRDRRLQNDRTFIDTFRHKMHRASGELAPPIERFFLHIEPRKRWQE